MRTGWIGVPGEERGAGQRLEEWRDTRETGGQWREQRERKSPRPILVGIVLDAAQIHASSGTLSTQPASDMCKRERYSLLAKSANLGRGSTVDMLHTYYRYPHFLLPQCPWTPFIIMYSIT